MNNKNTEIENINGLNDKTKADRNIYVSVVAVLLIVIAFITTIQSKVEKKISVNGNKISDKKTSNSDRCVYITGEVKKEGVVCVDANDNVSKAISRAGGVTENADISIIDETRKIVDGEKLHIISKDITTEKVNTVDKKEENNDKYTNNYENRIKININTASKEELEKLEGIGSITADKIIEYRKNNEFGNIEDLKNVSGIGDSKYARIVEKICVE